LSRSNVYYVPRPLPERDLVLMRRIDEIHLESPFFGSRKIVDQLRRDGHDVGRRHVVTLMRRGSRTFRAESSGFSAASHQC
jgi:putative transposase